MTTQDREIRNHTIAHIEAADGRVFKHEVTAALLDFDPSRGDAGFVALIDGSVVGAIWASFGVRPASVSEDIPDVQVFINSTGEQQGAGAALWQELTAHAQVVRWPGMALTISETNPARRIYARMGFESQSTPGLMLKLLRAPITRMAVYCGSSSAVDEDYVAAATEVGAELARRGIDVVYGGARVGLMGRVANGALRAGGRVIGVIPEHLKNREFVHEQLTELIVVDSMNERKQRMEALADAFLALPGGPGTLEELFEAFTLQQLGFHTAPMALLNVGGFYQPLIDMLERMVEEGFLDAKYLRSLVVGETIQEIFNKLERWRAPGPKWS